MTATIAIVMATPINGAYADASPVRVPICSTPIGITKLQSMMIPITVATVELIIESILPAMLIKSGKKFINLWKLF